MDKDYYDILGIKKDASVDEIKKAFRRQAIKHHPDRGGDEAKFKEINEAHEVLSNPEKRQRYDQFGSAGLGSGPSSSSSAGFNASDFSFNFGGDSGFGDILSSIFGNASGGSRRESRAGRDIEVVLDIDFKEAIFGVDKEINLTLNGVCPKCKGSQAEPGTKVDKCANCNGLGYNIRVGRTVFGNIQQQVTCQTCRGRGQEIKTPCKECSGSGITQQQKEVSLSIPAGIDDGQTIRLRSQGETNKKGVSGDLYVIIQVKPDKKFTREGDLILSEETINIVQASLGDNIKVETIDGMVTIKIPAGTQSGTDFRIDKKGVPHLKGNTRGSHIVRIIVEVPTKLTSKQKKALKELNLK